ncbi:MAG: ANTAR domain-containing protein [Gaiellaceae bacterium]
MSARRDEQGTGRELGAREALSREVNERIEGAAQVLDPAGEDRIALICECPQRDCTESLDLTHAEYEAVRSNPTHFVVKPGHDVPAIERIVRTGPHYLVVEKLGESAVAAIDIDASGEDAVDLIAFWQARATQLQQALESRVVIEQAKGVLAERFQLELDAAFVVLRAAARSQRMKINALAAEVVASHATPDAITEQLEAASGR